MSVEELGDWGVVSCSGLLLSLAGRKRLSDGPLYCRFTLRGWARYTVAVMSGTTRCLMNTFDASDAGDAGVVSCTPIAVRRSCRVYPLANTHPLSSMPTALCTSATD